MTLTLPAPPDKEWTGQSRPPGTDSPPFCYLRGVNAVAPSIDPASPAERSVARSFWIGLALLAAFRGLFVVFVPLDLTGDEAYYWDWGRRLSFGYFSKPPLIAWLMRFVGEVLGNREEAVRLASVTLGTVSLAAVFTLGRRLYGARIGLLAAALMAACPGNVALNFVLTIDPPLVCCWTLALLTSWRALEPDAPSGRRAAWAVAATLATGFGILAKQMMLVFPVGLLLFLLGSSQDRRILRGPWFWLATAVAMSFLVPTLMWNAANDWITFTHTQHHFEMNESTTFQDVLDNLGQFFGSQLGAISPVTWTLVVAVTISMTRGLRRLDRRARFLWCFFAPGLFVFFGLSIRQHVNANWPAAFYPAAMIAVAAWGTDVLRLGLRRWRGGLRWAIGVGAVLAAVVYVLPFAVTAVGGKAEKSLERLQGWEAYGAAIDRQLADLPADTFPLVVGHRYHASHLAFYAPTQPRVFRWAEPGRIDSQYELWGLPREAGRDALIIVHRGGEPPAELAAHFDSLTPLEPLHFVVGGRDRDYALYHGIGWRPRHPGAER